MVGIDKNHRARGLSRKKSEGGTLKSRFRRKKESGSWETKVINGASGKENDLNETERFPSILGVAGEGGGLLPSLGMTGGKTTEFKGLLRGGASIKLGRRKPRENR